MHCSISADSVAVQFLLKQTIHVYKGMKHQCILLQELNSDQHPFGSPVTYKLYMLKEKTNVFCQSLLQI